MTECSLHSVSLAHGLGAVLRLRNHFCPPGFKGDAGRLLLPIPWDAKEIDRRDESNDHEIASCRGVRHVCTKLEISIPTLIDGIDNKVGNAYAGMPDRLYLVGREGRIVYQGARGPFGFRPAELETAIEKELGE